MSVTNSIVGSLAIQRGTNCYVLIMYPPPFHNLANLASASFSYTGSCQFTTTPLDPTIVNEGDSVTLQCVYTNANAISWLRDNVAIETGFGYIVSESGPSQSNLTVQSAHRVIHNTTFSCLANLTDATTQRYDLQLLVHCEWSYIEALRVSIPWGIYIHSSNPRLVETALSSVYSVSANRRLHGDEICLLCTPLPVIGWGMYRVGIDWLYSTLSGSLNTWNCCY